MQYGQIYSSLENGLANQNNTFARIKVVEICKDFCITAYSTRNNDDDYKCTCARPCVGYMIKLTCTMTTVNRRMSGKDGMSI